MGREAKTLDEAKTLFAESTEPVTCTKEGKDPQTCNNADEAEAYFAD